MVFFLGTHKHILCDADTQLHHTNPDSLIYSKNVPRYVKRLAEHMEYDISVGDVVPFWGEIYSQDGTLRNLAEQAMSADDIMKMDWLVENVIGEIPSIDLLQEQAKHVVELKGVEESKE